MADHSSQRSGSFKDAQTHLSSTSRSGGTAGSEYHDAVRHQGDDDQRPVNSWRWNANQQETTAVTSYTPPSTGTNDGPLTAADEQQAQELDKHFGWCDKYPDYIPSRDKGSSKDATSTSQSGDKGGE
ncbi:hypothetical protein V865_008529 [Kwoniella europaea PYCC6329]|uniref:Uncharacterized protein n=1 Tax=Kwoniella europaea PYCC6329 TaxID=1423913 RepID=A0AAX4KWA3_9TREE